MRITSNITMHEKGTPRNAQNAFDFRAFKDAEYDHFIRSSNTYASINLYHPNGKQYMIDKIIGMASARCHIIDLEWISSTVVKLTFKGELK